MVSQFLHERFGRSSLPGCQAMSFFSSSLANTLSHFLHCTRKCWWACNSESMWCLPAQRHGLEASFSLRAVLAHNVDITGGSRRNPQTARESEASWRAQAESERWMGPATRTSCKGFLHQGVARLMGMGPWRSDAAWEDQQRLSVHPVAGREPSLRLARSSCSRAARRLEGCKGGQTQNRHKTTCTDWQICIDLHFAAGGVATQNWKNRIYVYTYVAGHSIQ